MVDGFDYSEALIQSPIDTHMKRSHYQGMLLNFF